MGRKLTVEDCRKMAEERGGKFLSESYTHTDEKYLWECEYGHVWETACRNIRSGCWCPECSGNKKKTIEDCCKMAKERNGECLSVEYINTGTHYMWKCQFGHIWSTAYDTIRSGYWCPECAGVAPGSIEKCKYLAEKNNGKCLSLNYGSAKDYYIWQCEFGHIWKARYNNVQQGAWCHNCTQDRRKKTSLERFGYEYPTQNPEVALRAAKSASNTYILTHWFSRERLICQGSWEKKVVEYLNYNRIDFLWQPQTFMMPNNKFTYRPDMYLPDEDLWIEIKGNFRGMALEKWKWFQSEYPNSELWDKKKLISLKIL